MRKPIAEQDCIELKLSILTFGLKHDLKIHPEKDLDGFCQRTIDVGHCPCKDHEKYCPCDVALEDCLRQGYCTCRLFATTEEYPNMLIKAENRRKEKRERRNSNSKTKTAKVPCD